MVVKKQPKIIQTKQKYSSLERLFVSFFSIVFSLFIFVALAYPKQSGFLGYWLVDYVLELCFGDFVFGFASLLAFSGSVTLFFKHVTLKRIYCSSFMLLVCGASAMSLYKDDLAGGLVGYAFFWVLNVVFGKKAMDLILLGIAIFFTVLISPSFFYNRFQDLVKGLVKTLSYVFGIFLNKEFWKALFYAKKLKAPIVKTIKKSSKNKDLLFPKVKEVEKHKVSRQIKIQESVEVPSKQKGYQLPPLTLLTDKKVSVQDTKRREALAHQKAAVLELALSSFNVKAKVVNISAGPSVVRYELEPGEGVKISKITTLAQDIALKMAVPSVRIEAPIPGKALVGIEVPSLIRESVVLKTLIDQTDFYKSKSILTSCLGLTITGDPVTFSLEEMPHLLIAGATGSGKSVCVNTIIMSILLRARPDQVKFVMIDPKKVELSLYNDIPHLLAPVVTNPQMAAATLKQWALKEMEQRYEMFSKIGVKDLKGYNKAEPDNPLPFIVVIIDELADLMMVASQEVEGTICRLAQMARATGIHLVIATQRPSVNVVTGLIKANVPSRIAFFVQSQIDSRTILDVAGAEKLLGKGDMFYSPVGEVAKRLQGVFIGEEDIKAVVDFVKMQATPEYNEELLSVELEEKQEAEIPDDVDVLFNEAKDLVQNTKRASTSYLQRKLKIGYNRAARLMDQLEEHQVIGVYDEESKVRPVL